MLLFIFDFITAAALERVRAHKVLLVSIFCAIVILIAFYVSFVSVPSAFVSDTIVSIENGMSTDQIGDELKQKNIIRSSGFFSLLVRLEGGTRGVKAGDYIFEKGQNAFTVAGRFIAGEYGFHQEKITIPEGLSSSDMADIFAKKLIHFNRADFISLASAEEGYLFPETYFFLPTTEMKNVVSTMRAMFDEKIKKLSKEIQASGRPLRDVVIMASILEEEARPESDMQDARIIAGILWKRLDNKIALQVDSAFRYSIGKTTETLTSADLKADSPYNTYTRRGLPPTPISNPGLSAILAAVTPIKTQYLYFLTGKDGAMHYAATLEDHVKNKNLYLR